MSITIVGLGPGDPELLTHRAWEVLSAAPEILLRTARHPTITALPTGAAVRAFDDLYDRAKDFSEVYAEIAEEVVRLGQRPQGVIYAVPGHPCVGEDSVRRVVALARERGVEVEIVAGVSFVTPVLSLLGIDALDGLQILDAVDVGNAHHPAVNPDLPVLLGQLYSRAIASNVKLTLMNLYPAEHPVTLVQGAGAWGALAETVPLCELDHERQLWKAAPHLTSLMVPALPATSSFESLAETVARLRAPGGCPWDQEQTHQSLRGDLLEEAYEVIAALDADDPGALCEELGDLLLNILMQVQIAVEGGEFSISDVIAHIDAKLKRRHPHVFGDTVVRTVDELLTNWEHIKRGEREAKAAANGEAAEPVSTLDGVPAALPALAQAQAYQKRAARVGFDWREVQGVVDKVHEEIAEVHTAQGETQRGAEVGDLLFAVVNWSRWLKVDAETALREANLRFGRRFRAVESAARAQRRELKDMTLEEADLLWEQVKAGEEEQGGLTPE
jgi:tetrapyrrole methylase family protein/MazG family protein